MYKLIFLFAFAIVTFSGCNHVNQSQKVDTVTAFYQYLNEQEFDEFSDLLSDSISVGEENYRAFYSNESYQNWLKWDAVFNPTYEVLDINQKGDAVHVEVSKSCKRILFLHQKPIISKDIFHFKNDKISKIETVEYIQFDEQKWVNEREKFLRCIDENNPELDGFIFDQTEKGGMNYLKAIEIYEKKCVLEE